MFKWFWTIFSFGARDYPPNTYYPVDKEVVIYPSDKHPLKNRGLSISNWGSSTVVTNGRFIHGHYSSKFISRKPRVI